MDEGVHWSGDCLQDNRDAQVHGGVAALLSACPHAVESRCRAWARLIVVCLDGSLVRRVDTVCAWEFFCVAYGGGARIKG